MNQPIEKSYQLDHDGYIIPDNHFAKSYGKAALVTAVVTAAITGIILSSALIQCSLHHVTFHRVINGPGCLTAIFMTGALTPFAFYFAYKYFSTHYKREHELQKDESAIPSSTGKVNNQYAELAQSPFRWDEFLSFEELSPWIYHSDAPVGLTDSTDGDSPLSPQRGLTEDSPSGEVGDQSAALHTGEDPPIYEYYHEIGGWLPEPARDSES